LAFVSNAFQIRLATAADLELISWHRARMFRDMGELPPELFETFRIQSREKLHHMFKRDEYIGWLVSLANDPTSLSPERALSYGKCRRIRNQMRTARSTSSPAVRRSSKMFTLKGNGAGAA
jgi:hypothetical protein